MCEYRSGTDLFGLVSSALGLGPKHRRHGKQRDDDHDGDRPAFDRLCLCSCANCCTDEAGSRGW